MSEPWDDPEVKAFLARAKTEMFPKLKGSALSVTIVNDDPDPKLCVEIGAAILFDKPIIAVVPKGMRVPNNLRRVASCIVELDDDGMSAEGAVKIKRAIENVLKNDKRTRTR